MMNTYVVLLRGINVGGKNKAPMVELKNCLEELGISNVTTYIASGNVIVSTNQSASDVKQLIEDELPRKFKLDSELIKVLVLTRNQLQSIVDNKPEGFGDFPDTYHSDVIFLLDIDTKAALPIFSPLDGVDTIWPGNNVIYSQRLSSERTKSRLNKIVGTPAYKSMTIRTWNTTIKLLNLLATNKPTH